MSVNELNCEETINSCINKTIFSVNNNNNNNNNNTNIVNNNSKEETNKNLNTFCIKNIKKTTTTNRGMSESSTTSDNTTEFIDIVKKYDVVYNTQNPDYKNVEVKMKVWTQIAEEIGLSVDASKRKWKNLRDSYTKYLRSFRTGTKTSKKYQYWAHADHMEFLKPYQGPGRNLNTPVNANKTTEEEDTAEVADTGFQVISKGTNNISNGIKAEDEHQAQATAPATSTTDLTTANTQTTSNTKQQQLAVSLSGVVAAPSITVPSIVATSSIPTSLSTPSTSVALSSALPSAISSAFLTSSAPTIATIPPTMNITTTAVAAAAAAAAAAASISSSLSSISTTNSLANSHLNLLPLTSSANCLTAPTTINGLPNPLSLLPIPSLPTVQLPPQLTGKSLLASLPLPPTSGATPLLPQIFPLPNNGNKSLLPPLPSAVGNANAPGNVGCFILEPHLFANADAFKKELSSAALNLMNSLSCSTAPTATFSTPLTKINPPPSTPTLTNTASMTKIRRVQPSPQTTAINLSLNANTNHSLANPTTTTSISTTIATPVPVTNNTAASGGAQPIDPSKTTRKANKRSAEIDIGAILQANRDLDANTLFFLSLSKTVRAMPTKFQSLAKMRCMRIVSDLELELENMDLPIEEQIANGANNNKFCSIDSPSPPDATAVGQNPILNSISESNTEHFVYVMSPSRVENMIDLSSDDDGNAN